MPLIKINPYKHNKKSNVSRVSDCNTIRETQISPRKRARRWCFTLNNPVVNETVSLSQRFYEELKTKYFIFQEEIGKNGTPHLQGCIEFKNQISFSTLKKFDNRFHWEICRNWEGSKKYCSKKETRVGNVYCSNDNQIVVIPLKVSEEEIKELIEEVMKTPFCMCMTYRCTCVVSEPLRAVVRSATPPLTISSPTKKQV